MERFQVTLCRPCWFTKFMFTLCPAPWKGIQGSLGFWISRCKFQIPGNWIPVFVKRTWILDSSRLWDSGFHTVNSGFQVTGFQSLSVELGLWIPIDCGIPDSLSCILDSLSKNFPDSGIRTPLPWAICRVAFAPAQKLYRVGPLFTQNNGYFGAISVTEQSCAASISEVETHVSERCSILYRIDFDIGQGPINVNN